MERILVVGQSGNPGGVEAVIKRYYMAVKEDIVFDFLIFTDTCYDYDFYKENGSNIYFIKTPQFRKPISYKKEVKAFFEKQRGIYNSIWVNCCDLANFGFIIKCAKEYGIKKRIVHAHNNKLMQTGKRRILYSYMHWFWKHNIHRYATDFWACSQLAGGFFYTAKVLKSKEYRVIKNAFEIEKFAHDYQVRKQIRAGFNIDEKCVVIGHVGRFQYQKNQKFLIEIYNEYYKINPNSRLLLVGQGEDFDKIKELVRTKKLDKNVIFTGARNDVEKLVQAMDIFVLPSRFEGLGIVLIEAQTAGLPCVTSKDVVPLDANVTGNVEFVGLNQDISDWIKAIEKQNKLEIDYDACVKKVTLAGYDIKVEGEKFKKLITG